MSQMRAFQSPALRLVAVLVLALLSLAVYVAIAGLSSKFAYDAPLADRPIPAVVALFGVAFALYLAAAWVASRSAPSRSMLAVIIGSSVVLRFVMLTSTPILEVDIYRYLWDGAVTARGINPYRFTPEQVLLAPDDSKLNDDLSRLRDIKNEDRALKTILNRIHFGFLPSVYPPTSQLVFAGATGLMPERASVDQRVMIMKACLVAFDLVTLFVVAGLLRLAGRPLELCVLYGWCPLLIKEFANSGHLDSIAVFLTAVSVYGAAAATQRGTGSLAGSPKRPLLLAASMVALAMAVGAKLYPIVLFPIIVARIVQQTRSWRDASISIGCFVFSVALILAPMWLVDHHNQVSLLVDDATDGERTTRPVVPTDGLVVFLSEWEMNDFAFLIVIENLKPDSHLTTNARAWFVMTSNQLRTELVGWGSQVFSIPAPQTPFAMARAVTAVVFLCLVAWLMRAASRDRSLAYWLRAIFLTLAWFWLLCPTQNPWYWAWVIPFLPFAGARSWVLMSGLVFAYYLRFWFDLHWHDSTVWVTPYRGAGFFDLIVTWIEFGPWFGLLAFETWYNGRCESGSAAIS